MGTDRHVEPKHPHIETHSGLGMAWFVGWLFTVGFLSKGFWGGVLALIVWPYMLGNHFQP